MRISDWSSDVCSSDLAESRLSTAEWLVIPNPESRPSRHWKIALCSLSIGTMQAPPSRAAAISSSPASTSDSLLASSRRLPARAAARVESSPAAPTMAATTRSEEHTSELQSLMRNSYAGFVLTTKQQKNIHQ